MGVGWEEIHIYGSPVFTSERLTIVPKHFGPKILIQILALTDTTPQAPRL